MCDRDSQILLENGTLKKISNFTGNETVITFDRNTLQESPSKIKNYFCKMPDKLLKITTISGHKIKCTSDHPLLVSNMQGKYEWRKARDLTLNDQLIVKSTPKYICVKIDNIEQIASEPVYDFETFSDNHSFVCNNFGSSNCIVETSEGHKVGLVKNLALMGNVTVMMPEQIELVKSLIRDKVQKIDDVASTKLKDYTRVFVNGEWIGITQEARKLYLDLKQRKYTGQLDIHTGIVHEIKSEVESKELRICCDSGRLFRPLLRVENNKVLLNKKITGMIAMENTKNPVKISSWNEFMAKHPGVVEFIDVDEQANSMLSMFPKEVENIEYG